LKPERLGFLAAFLIPAILYAASASPEPASWDTAELQGVPYILGISHPTGFPFYTLLGYVWSHVFAFGSIAWRMNVMSGIAIAVSCAAAYGTALEFGADLPIALFATLWFAVTPNVWQHASRAEAQDLAVMCSALAIYAFVRWMKGAPDAWFVAALGLFGLGMAAHPNAVWLVLALVVGALIAKRRPGWKTVAMSLALVLASLMLYLYLPLRSAYIVAHGLDPAASLAGAGGGLFWNYNDPRTLHGFISELTGSQFETPTYFLASFNPLHVQDALWAFISSINAQYGAVALLLIFLGFAAAWRRDWRTTLVLTVACTASLLFLVVYPNESDVGRYRLLASWIAVLLLGALTPSLRGGITGGLSYAALLAFLAVNAGLTFESQRGFLSHASGEGGRWVIDAVRPFVPPGSVLVTGWLDATSLAYGAYVDGSLPGRIIVSDDQLRADFYRHWTNGRRVFILVNPRDVGQIPGTRDVASLDAFHELFEVQP
jgi:Protein of unknown function (DUF2723)